MDVSDAKRLRSLEDENASCRRHASGMKLKMLLDNAILKDVNSRKW